MIVVELCECVVVYSDCQGNYARSQYFIMIASGIVSVCSSLNLLPVKLCAWLLVYIDCP